MITIGAGTIIRLGEQKLNNYFVGEQKLVKNNSDSHIQCTMGSGQSPRSRGILKNFCVRSNITVCKVTFNCKLQRKLGEQDVLVAPPITVPAPMMIMRTNKFSV